MSTGIVFAALHRQTTPYADLTSTEHIPNAKPFSFEPHERVWHKARNNISL